MNLRRNPTITADLIIEAARQLEQLGDHADPDRVAFIALMLRNVAADLQPAPIIDRTHDV